MYSQYSVPYMNPYGMQPTMQPAGISQTNFMQPQQPQQQGGPDWIMASSIKQVEQVSVQPGQKAWIMVQNAPIFALRTADNMGLVTTDYYKFEKFIPGDVESPSTDYVTRDEFNKFVESMKERMAEK